MENVFYCEINIICLILILIVSHSMRLRSSLRSVDMQILHVLMIAAGLMLVTDSIGQVFAGTTYSFSRVLIFLADSIYYEALAFLAMEWFFYVHQKLGITLSTAQYWIGDIPFIIFTVFLIVNPFTGVLFTVDELGVYSRSGGVVIHWIVTWGYLIVSVFLVLRGIIREKNRLKRQELIPVLMFVVWPVIGSILQMFFYGITSTGPGIAIAIVYVVLNTQENMVSIDSLTGLNNRRAFNIYMDSIIEKNYDQDIHILMMDLNNFKQINDRLGHLEGDKALVDAANAIKVACGVSGGRVFLCRYGGDEFVITCLEYNQTKVNELIQTIRYYLAKVNTEGKPYKLDASIGHSYGRCNSLEELDDLVHQADEAMYKEKKATIRNSR